MFRRLALATLLLALTFGGVRTASGYNLFGPYPWGTEGETYYNKWGDIFTPGSSGGTITWSIMPDGTTIDPGFSDGNITGTSSLNAIMQGLGQAEALEAIERCFGRWSAVANIRFEQVADSGVPFHSPEAVGPATGQIRLGAFAISGGGGAVGYAPPPNGGTLEGDVLLNSSNTFFFDDGAEGDLIDVFNDFESLLMHETAHAIGIDHSDTQSVTSPNFEIFKYVNRELDPDDIAASQFLYGPALAADFDDDGDVDEQDLNTWVAGFGESSGALHTSGDADGDGDIDGSDFLAWQREAQPGTAESQAAQAPEPATHEMTLAAAAFAILGSRRR